MEKMDKKQIKEISVKLMADLDIFCKTYDITYFLAYGTLLGTIRHKGFIPWDDDIDIYMTRDQYDKFIRNFQDHPMENAALLNPLTNKKYPYPYLKVFYKNTLIKEKMLKNDYAGGIWIDIFPLDCYQKNTLKRMKMRLLDMKRILAMSEAPAQGKNKIKNFFKKILFIFYKNKDANKYALKMIELCNRFGNEDILYMPFDTSKRLKLYKAKYFKAVESRTFEDYQFCIPIGFDEILKIEYGDYMKLPPEDKRTTHNLEAWRLN